MILEGHAQTTHELHQAHIMGGGTGMRVCVPPTLRSKLNFLWTLPPLPLFDVFCHHWSIYELIAWNFRYIIRSQVFWSNLVTWIVSDCYKIIKPIVSYSDIQSHALFFCPSFLIILLIPGWRNTVYSSQHTTKNRLLSRRRQITPSYKWFRGNCQRLPWNICSWFHRTE